MATRKNSNIGINLSKGSSNGAVLVNNTLQLASEVLQAPYYQELFDDETILEKYYGSTIGTETGTVRATWTVDQDARTLTASGGTNALLFLNGDDTFSNVISADVDIEISTNKCYDGGIIGRVKDANNLYLLVISDTNTNKLNLYKKINGTWTSLAVSTTAPITQGQNNIVRFTITNNILEAYVNGTKYISYQDTSNSIIVAGKCGFRQNSGANTFVIQRASFYHVKKSNIDVNLNGYWESDAIDLGQYFKEVKSVSIDSIPAPNVEINFDMTSNATPSPYVASASSVWSTVFPAWKAFSTLVSDNTNGWASASGTTSGWIQIDLGVGNEKRITKYDIQKRYDDNANSCPKSWTFLGSNNGSTWDTLDTRLNIMDWNSDATTPDIKEFYITNKNSYRYYRLNVTSTVGGGIVVISKLNLYESVDSKVYTATSSNGIGFTEFVQINSNGTINSPQNKYIKVKVELVSGKKNETSLIHHYTIDEQAKFIGIDNDVDITNGLSLKNVTTIYASQDTSFSDTGYVYSKLIDKSNYKKINKITT